MRAGIRLCGIGFTFPALTHGAGITIKQFAVVVTYFFAAAGAFDAFACEHGPNRHNENNDSEYDCDNNEELHGFYYTLILWGIPIVEENSIWV